MKNLLLAAIIFGFISCKGKERIDLKEIALKDLRGREVSLNETAEKGLTVFIFMSTDCPLCINYTKTITEISKEFGSRGVSFIPVYSGKYFTETDILKFHHDTNFELTGLLDPEFRLAIKLGATVTPEAVVISREGEILYSGAIDNWMYETGKKRSLITQKYLESALLQILSGKAADPRHTEPIGCFMEL